MFFNYSASIINIITRQRHYSKKKKYKKKKKKIIININIKITSKLTVHLPTRISLLKKALYEIRFHHFYNYKQSK